MSRTLSALTDQILVGNPAVLQNVVPMTYAAWISPTGYGNPSAGRVINKADPTTGKGHALFLQSTGGGQVIAQVSKAVTDAQAVAAFPAALLSVPALPLWIFLAMTYQAGDGGPRLWQGTVQAAVAELVYVSRTDGAGALTDLSGFNLLLGAADLAAKNVFQGRLANVTVWSGVLSQSELDQLRLFPEGSCHSFDAILLAQWPLDEAVAQGIARDISGNNLNAAVTGTVKSTQQAREVNGSIGY